MPDQLFTTIRQLLRAQTENEIRTAAAGAFDKLVDADQSTIVSADQFTGESRLQDTAGALDVPNQRLLVSGLIGQAYTSGETLIVDDLLDTRSTSTESNASEFTWSRSLLCVPVDGLGVLVAADTNQGKFSDDDLETIEELRSYLAAAYDRITTSDVASQEDDRCQDIANILAHDVRNPLVVANGHLELAQEEFDSEHLNKVATAHDRLGELIDGVVQIARTGEYVSDTGPIDLQEIAERAWRGVQTHEAKLSITESSTVFADESNLCQLFENLFRNAVTHAGSAVSVRIGLLPDMSGFYVEDDGIGIPHKDRTHVFERGYSSTDEQTGYGLSIVQKIVDAHDWEITLTESESGGARFEIEGVRIE